VHPQRGPPRHLEARGVPAVATHEHLAQRQHRAAHVDAHGHAPAAARAGRQAQHARDAEALAPPRAPEGAVALELELGGAGPNVSSPSCIANVAGT
jgi:hypothetical protein